MAGASTRELAARYSVHRTTVAQHLRVNGVSTRAHTRKLTDDDLGAIADRYAAGDSTATIAASYNVDPATIGRELKRAGYQLRPRCGG